MYLSDAAITILSSQCCHAVVTVLLSLHCRHNDMSVNICIIFSNVVCIVECTLDELIPWVTVCNISTITGYHGSYDARNGKLAELH